MKIKLRVTICTDGWDRLFGEGPYQLLLGIRELGSLRSSAQHMGMAYTKAFHMVKHLESILGFPITRRTIGGHKGGGSVLTEEAEALISRYDAYRSACSQAAHALFDQYFNDFAPLQDAAQSKIQDPDETAK